jgi:hypothetical protein
MNLEPQLCLRVSILESILTGTSVSIDSNEVTENLSPLESAFTKNQGRVEGGGVHPIRDDASIYQIVGQLFKRRLH